MRGYRTTRHGTHTPSGALLSESASQTPLTNDCSSLSQDSACLICSPAHRAATSKWSLRSPSASLVSKKKKKMEWSKPGEAKCLNGFACDYVILLLGAEDNVSSSSKTKVLPGLFQVPFIPLSRGQGRGRSQVSWTRTASAGAQFIFCQWGQPRRTWFPDLRV